MHEHEHEYENMLERFNAVQRIKMNKQKARGMLQFEAAVAVDSVLALSWICGCGWVVVAMSN